MSASVAAAGAVGRSTEAFGAKACVFMVGDVLRRRPGGERANDYRSAGSSSGAAAMSVAIFAGLNGGRGGAAPQSCAPPSFVARPKYVWAAVPQIRPWHGPMPQ